ncbi:universal stress protein [Paucihalobacter ruber]|uniref:Universal stress protein n=1 Tax=Paucihalobacter ruber TaxID=2567861 RepID=A0A506PIT7_9FLAO|nr:universal stress protein [Paucihalobacter ruber]TPV33494.1 universal stress protein [Paucihalobacter ruber]
MKRILLPTDFSKNAWNAISYAAQLFKNETCTFYLLHTYTPIIYHTEFVMLNPNDIEISNIVRETAEKDMEETRKKLVENYPNSQHEVETIVSFNTLISEIKDQMEKLKIDYIVMGTKGATGATEVLFGTNTVHVLNHIKCPLIAVSEKYKAESPKNVLFPSDFYINFEEKHIQPIVDVVKPNNSNLNVLHVSHGYELSYKNLQNKNKLETLLGDTNFKFHDVSDDSLENAINKFIKEQHIDLLVLINNKKSFFENLFFRPFVNKMGLHLEIPLMVIPSYAK